MVKKHTWQLFILAEEHIPDFPRKIGSYLLDLTWFQAADVLLNYTGQTIPDLILAKDDHPEFRGGDLIFELRKKWDAFPILLITNTIREELIIEIFEAGGCGYIREQQLKADLLSAILNEQAHRTEQEEHGILVKNLASLTAQLQEKNVIFKTIVDLITHDTRNLFSYIFTMISQVKDKSLKIILDNAVHELNECILEAYGYLKEQKRIRPVISMVENLRLEKKRIILKNHPRISYSFTSKYILFIEVSALFKNAVLNIIENALKFSAEEQPVVINLSRDSEFVWITIADRGPGVADQDKSRIFNRNFRIERDLPLDGSGRGLWITRNIIEKEQGRITVTDNPGGGTIFIVKVPAFTVGDFEKGLHRLSEWFGVAPLAIEYKAMALRTLLSYQELGGNYDLDSIIYANLVETLREEARSRNKKHFHKKLTELQALNPGGKSVLIIDDSIHVHYYLASHLTDIGYRVAGYARNGAEGLSYYKTLKPDLVTLDFTMPVMSGVEAAVEIIKINEDARILFITGIGGHPKFIQSVKAKIPVDNYRIVKKPFKKEFLAAILEGFC